MGRVSEGWKVFCELANESEEAKKLMAGWGKVVQFVVDGETPPEFYIDCAGGAASFSEGKHASPSFTMKGSAEIMGKLLTREEDATKAYMAKKYTIEGSLADAMKFGQIGNAVAKTAEAKFGSVSNAVAKIAEERGIKLE